MVTFQKLSSHMSKSKLDLLSLKKMQQMEIANHVRQQFVMHYVSVQKDTLFPPKAVWRAITLSLQLSRVKMPCKSFTNYTHARCESTHAVLTIPQLGLEMGEQVHCMPVNHQDHIICSYRHSHKQRRKYIIRFSLVKDFTPEATKFNKILSWS